MEEKRTALIQIVVTPREKERIKELARKNNMDMSNFIRTKCLK